TSGVTYLSGRADALQVFFLLAAVVCAVRAFQYCRFRWAGGSALCLTAAVFSKETTAVAPAVLLIVLVLERARFDTAQKKRMAAALLAGWIGAVLLYIGARLCAIPDLFRMRTVAGARLPAVERMLTGAASFAEYLRIFLLPYDLRLERTMPLVQSAADPAFLAAVFIFAAFGALLWLRRKKRDMFFYGIGWYMLWYLPVSNIVLPLNALIAENWLQVPALGLFAAAAVLIQECRDAAPQRYRRVAAIFFAGLCVMWGLLTAARNIEYTQPLRFYRHALRYEPENVKLYNNLAIEYAERGRNAEAVAAYRQALSRAPCDLTALQNLANILYSQGNTAEAIEHYEHILCHAPRHVVALNSLGGIYGGQGDTARAIPYWERSLAVTPAQPEISAYVQWYRRNQENQTAE
ncbi:MAG: tetratricopeptide repeat protein, partial [Candidatus Omnitrophica bacterium]|nr:tetratricopeptide repeat protein [Candidatus Omnitrophota bacterium]